MHEYKRRNRLFTNLKLDKERAKIAEMILNEILSRLNFLKMSD